MDNTEFTASSRSSLGLVPIDNMAGKCYYQFQYSERLSGIADMCKVGLIKDFLLEKACSSSTTLLSLVLHAFFWGGLRGIHLVEHWSGIERLGRRYYEG